MDRQQSSDLCPSSLYRPLSEHPAEFRLLVLAPGDHDSGIRCNLIHQPLESSVTRKYETVSYCWGDESDTTSLHVDNVLIKVPRSAASALRRLRSENCDRVLWIDAICINQYDDHERSHQVARMHLIYQNGARNLVWLGEDDGTLGNAIHSLQLIKDDMAEEITDMATFCGTVATGDGLLRSARTGFSTTLALPALLKFFSRPWFSRLWIVQEAGLAASNLCYCGTYELDLTDVLRAAEWLTYKREDLRQPFDMLQKLMRRLGFAILLSDFANPSGTFQNPRLQVGIGHSLYTLLRNLAHFQARDPRDHIYGVLGLYRTLSPQDKIPDALVPDYSKQWPEVFRDATRFAVVESGSLDAIAWTIHRLHDDERPLDMPSWVPSWHRRFDPGLDSSAFSGFFDAGKGSHARILKSHNSILSLKGLYVDGHEAAQIMGVSDLCEDAGGLKSFLQNVERLVEKYSIGGTSSANFLGHLVVLAATLLAGRSLNNDPANQDDTRDFKALQTYRAKFGTFPPSAWQLRRATEIHDEDTWAAARFLDRAWIACSRRRAFVTKDGRIGLGPQTMTRGDVVTVLYGGRKPFILRPTGDNFQFIGQCYVHGIMYGEAVEKLEAQEREDVTFNLV